MSVKIEYGSKAAADAARERHSEHLCPVDDDRRLMTVAYQSDTPDSVLDLERLEAADSRGERSDGPGQVPLSDAERERIDFISGRANVPHAKAVKGIATAEGVEDWLSYYDPELTVDEHREVMQRAAKESGARSGDVDVDEKAGRAAKAAKSDRCDHARGHCAAGDPEACEFLTETYQYTLDEVRNDVLNERAPDPRPDPTHPDDHDPLTGKQKGALKQSWQGYKGAIAEVEAAISSLRESWEQAQQAARAINAIRSAAGQDAIDFERLEEEQARVLDFSRMMAADCHECGANHSGHDHAVTNGPRENVTEAVVEGAETTPVGTSTDVIERDAQRDLQGDRADDQARLAGGEQGERGQGEVVETTDENPGGIMADEREPDQGSGETEQQVPDAFRVAEGGQETL